MIPVGWSQTLRPHATALVALIAATACTRPDGAPAYQPPLGVPQFTIGATPTVTFADAGPGTTPFYRVTARRLANKTLIVADGASHMIYAFDSLAKSAHLLAKEGNGPGELHGTFRLSTRGDTILVMLQGMRTTTATYRYTSVRGFLDAVSLNAVGAVRPTLLDAVGQNAFLIRRGGSATVLDAAPPLNRLIPYSAE